MKIYDISQEVFGCEVYPGDPAPEKEIKLRIEDGAVCNLSALHMCAHNGTHVDAPYHFLNDGKTIDQVALERFIGYAYVAEHNGEISADDAVAILEKARAADAAEAGRRRADDSGSDTGTLGAEKRILVKGDAIVTPEAAKAFAEAGILLFGNESQTVGPLDAPMAVHLIMLGAEIVLLEGIRLSEVPEGVYLLHAAPLNLGGADGAPCRATLM
ncbi:MAG: cyclase family protein, partial [Clostridiales bacterium]|nr:cyclase family protein [Clostridiales bacterium]